MESRAHDGGIVIAPRLLPGAVENAADPPGGDSKISGSFRRFALAGGFDYLNYVTLVKPGIAIAGVANGPHSYFGGVKSSVEFMACSQVTACPV